MADINLIVGDDGGNTLQGGAAGDLIYGFDPNGPQGTVTSIAAMRVATGLSQPLFTVSPPGDLGRLFIVEKTGLIRILDIDTGQILPAPFLNLTGQIATSGEQGLLGLAFHPDFGNNGFFYVNLINTSGDTEVRRYQVSSLNPDVADAASATLVLAVDQPAGLTNHKAGWLDFGPDGYLYVPLGDGGGGGDPNNNAQNLDSLLGKMLRLDVDADGFPADATRNYAIPADNPFVGATGADEIWALGLRNPWRPSFDRGLGDLYIADVGQNVWEEINLGQAGANYGWDLREGPDPFSGGSTPAPIPFTDPIYSYQLPDAQSITGGYVYRGPSEGLHGRYFFADFIHGKLFTLHFDGASWIVADRTSEIVADAGAINMPASFGQDGLGNLYVVDIDGDVFRLTPDASSADQADVLNGLGGADMLFGGSGGDTLDGGSGNDELHGQNGNDHLVGGAGADVLDGGAGHDFAQYVTAASGVTADVLSPGVNSGDAAGDRYFSIEGLVGSGFNDLLRTDGLVSSIWALDGDDTLDGRNGNDDLHGQNGNDHLIGGAGADVLDGGFGFDFAHYDAAPSGFTVDLLSPGNSTGEAVGDQYFSIEGVVGSEFDDVMRMDDIVNSIWALDGDDILYGRGGNDDLHGQNGNDHLIGGAGADVLDGGFGYDFAHYDDAPSGFVTDLLNPGNSTGDALGDQYFSIEGVVGSLFDDLLRMDDFVNSVWALDGDDTLMGLGDSDDLHGQEGNDHLWGGAGGDVLDGGFGFDFAHYDDVLSGFTVDLLFPGNSTGDAVGDQYFSIEGVVGSLFDDLVRMDDFVNSIWALDGADTLEGRGANDDLHGQNGADSIDGGADADVLEGGAGNDVFLFHLGEANNDMILDFDGLGASAGDSLQFEGYGTAAAGATFTNVNATTWSINSADGLTHDIITLANSAIVHSSDYLFG